MWRSYHLIQLRYNVIVSYQCLQHWRPIIISSWYDSNVTRPLNIPQLISLLLSVLAILLLHSLHHSPSWFITITPTLHNPTILIRRFGDHGRNDCKEISPSTNHTTEEYLQSDEEEPILWLKFYSLDKRAIRLLAYADSSFSVVENYRCQLGFVIFVTDKTKKVNHGRFRLLIGIRDDLSHIMVQRITVSILADSDSIVYVDDTFHHHDQETLNHKSPGLSWSLSRSKTRQNLLGKFSNQSSRQTHQTAKVVTHPECNEWMENPSVRRAMGHTTFCTVKRSYAETDRNGKTTQSTITSKRTIFYLWSLQSLTLSLLFSFLLLILLYYLSPSLCLPSYLNSTFPA